MVEKILKTIEVKEDGQIIIPRELRNKLSIKSKTKFLVMSYNDTLLLKKVLAPDKEEEFNEIKKDIRKRIKKFGELTSEEINKEIAKSRQK